MNKLIRNMLLRTKGKALLFSLAFFIIFIISPIALYSLKDTQATIKSDITHYSRGSYDLLVRPPNAVTTIEKELGLVPENYLGGGQGGISIEQWQKLKNRRDLEIVAPVSSLGYYTGILSTLGVDPVPIEASRYSVKYITSDGINDYTFKKYDRFFLEANGGFWPLESILNDLDLAGYFVPTAAAFPLPITYHHLVAIDPKEEEKLTGVSFENVTHGKESLGLVKNMYANSEMAKNATIIPVMQLQNSSLGIKAEIEVATLPLDVNDTIQFENRFGINKNEDMNNSFMNYWGTKEFDNFLKELEKIKTKNAHSKVVELNSILKPFNTEGKGFKIKETGEVENLVATDGYIHSVDFNIVSVYYMAKPIQYEKNGNLLKVKKTNEVNGIPIYREIQQIGQPILDAESKNEQVQVSILIDPTGTYDIADKTDSLASSPLGIYQLAPVTYTDNDKDKKTMTPTITPGSFVTAAAEGVTNIQSSEAIKGDKPIDAIRIKVANIDGYSPAAAKKIEQVAKEIENMGLHVDIVAGSSLQLIDVEVEGIGIVQESWTSLGAAGTIINQWNLTNFILVLSFLFVTVIYMYHRMKIWALQKETDIMYFIQLGWKKSHIIKLLGKEVLILTALAGIASITVVTIVYTQINITSFVFFLHIGIVLSTCLVLYLLVINSIKKVGQTSKQTNTDIKRKQWKSLITKNMYFYREQIFSPFIQLLVVSALSLFVYLSLTETITQTNLTILGEHINVRTSSWHVALIIGAYLLATITLIESILSVFQTRKQEIGIYLSIGWRLSHIFQFYMKEIAIWTGIALLIGNVLSFFLYITFFPLRPDSILALTLTFFGFYVFILLLSSFVLRKILRKEVGKHLTLQR